MIQRVIHQVAVPLRLTEAQLPRLGAVLQQVQRKSRNVTIEASTTRKTGITMCIIKGPSEASVQQAKKELTAALARRVTLTVLVPAALRSFVIGPGGKHIKAITERTGVRIDVPPRPDDTPMEGDPLLGVQLEVTIEGDEVNAQQARAMIETIVAERTSKISQRVPVDPVFLPFVAGARGANAAALAAGPGRGEVTVKVQRADVLVSGERDAVAEVVRAIEAQVAEMRRTFRTLTLQIPKRQHQFMTGDVAAEILATTQCSIELPPNSDPSEAVTIRGPQQQLPHALTAAIERANAVSVHAVDLGALHTHSDADAAQLHAQRLAQWLGSRVPREKGVTVHMPRAGSASAVEVVGEDAAAVAQVAAAVEALAKPLAPARVRSIDVDPLAHEFIVGRRGQGLKPFESRGIDVLVPPENSGRADVLLVLSRMAAEAGDEAAAAALLDSATAELASTASIAADLATEHLSVPSKFHGAILGPERTVLNAIVGDDKLLVLLGGRGSSARYVEAPSADSIVVRGAREAVERAVAKIRAIAADAEHDSIVNGHVETFEVPSTYVPRLVGRGGAGLNKLREELGVRIDVADKDRAAPPSAPTSVRLTGRKECVAEARGRIEAQVARFADETTAKLRVPAKLHGSLIGQGGKYVQRLQDKYEVYISFPHGDAGDDGLAKDEVSVRGPSKGVAAAKAELLELLEYERERDNAEELTIPDAAVPRVLGRGGATINQLRLETGAMIDLDRGADGHDGTLRLRGSREAIQAARAAIEEIVARVESEATLHVSIPSEFHGSLIGGGGLRLRELIQQAGGPAESREHAQMVRFPRGSATPDVVVVRAEKELAARIAAALESASNELASRVVYGAAVPPRDTARGRPSATSASCCRTGASTAHSPSRRTPRTSQTPRRRASSRCTVLRTRSRRLSLRLHRWSLSASARLAAAPRQRRPPPTHASTTPRRAEAWPRQIGSH